MSLEQGKSVIIVTDRSWQLNFAIDQYSHIWGARQRYEIIWIDSIILHRYCNHPCRKEATIVYILDRKDTRERTSTSNSRVFITNLAAPASFDSVPSSTSPAAEPNLCSGRIFLLRICEGSKKAMTDSLLNNNLQPFFFPPKKKLR